VVVLEGEANPQDGARELEQALCLSRGGKNETLRKDCPFQVVCEQQMKKCKSRKPTVLVEMPDLCQGKWTLRKTMGEQAI